MSRRSRAVCVLVLVAAAGCSRDGAARDLAAAAAATRRSGIARYSFSRAPLGGQRGVKISGEGVADFRSDDLSLALQSGGAAAEFRKVGDVIYTKAGGIGVPELISGTWIASGSLPAQPEFRSLFQNPGGVPLEVLEAERGVGEARFVQRGKIRGVAVEHYRADVEPIDAFDSMREAARKAGRDAEKLLRERTSGKLDVWLDRRGRVRRIRLALEPATGKLPGLDYRPAASSVEFWDFGADLKIEAPPPDQVREEESLEPTPAP